MITSCTDDVKYDFDGFYYSFNSHESNATECKLYSFESDTLKILNVKNNMIVKYLIENVSKDQILVKNQNESLRMGYSKDDNILKLYFQTGNEPSFNVNALSPLQVKEVDLSYLKKCWKGYPNQLREDLLFHWYFFQDEDILRPFAKFKGVNNRVSALANLEYHLQDFDGVQILTFSNDEKYIISLLTDSSLALEYIDFGDQKLKSILHKPENLDNPSLMGSWARVKSENVYDLPEKILFKADTITALNANNNETDKVVTGKYFLGPDASFLFANIFDNNPVTIQKLNKDSLLLSKFNPITLEERSLYLKDTVHNKY
ncbi:MAG: hypothetical protein AAGB24_11310 [Bacteroidota bacterium]